MSIGSTPRMHADDVLAIRREDVVLRAGGMRRADLRGLLAEARHPQGELALPLQVRRLDVEAPARPPCRGRSRRSRHPSRRSRYGRYSAAESLGCERARRARAAAPSALGADRSRHHRSNAIARPGALRRFRQPPPPTSRTLSTDSASPMRSGCPPARTRAPIRPASKNARPPRPSSSPVASQTKLPCGSGTCQPCVDERRRAGRRARVGDRVHALEQLVLVVEARRSPRPAACSGHRQRDRGRARGIQDVRRWPTA